MKSTLQWRAERRKPPGYAQRVTRRLTPLGSPALTGTALVLLCCISQAPALDEVIDSPMYRSPPALGRPSAYRHQPELVPLWLRALERPEMEMKVQAAAAIALAHRRGMKGLDATAAPLTATLDAANQPAVRLSAAEALIVIDAKQTAAHLFKQAEAGGIELRELIEPALARWDYRPARAMWLARVQDSSTPPRSLVLAIAGLSAVREEKAIEPLTALVLRAETAAPVRLEAGRALGALCDAGLEKPSATLAADGTPGGIIGRLAAVHMLRRHHGAAAVAVLQSLARDKAPDVAVVAAGRLLEIDPALTLPMLDALVANAEPNVRLVGVETAFRLPTKERVAILSDRLSDAHPTIRRQARQRLRELTDRPELRPWVIDAATGVLAGKNWRGLEQACILLAQLNHRPAAPRLVQLLEADRPEVFITAAWALRQLDVPESLPAILKYAEAEFARHGQSKPLPGRAEVQPHVVDFQLAQLNQLLGLARYRPAETLLRRFVPKQIIIDESRAAAIWALGWLHEGKLDAELASLLEARLNDTFSIPPESPPVRRMSAMTLGRMKADPALPSLRKYWHGKETEDMTGIACGWAIEQITGEKAEPPATKYQVYRDWFLAPKE